MSHTLMTRPPLSQFASSTLYVTIKLTDHFVCCWHLLLKQLGSIAPYGLMLDEALRWHSALGAASNLSRCILGLIGVHRDCCRYEVTRSPSGDN